MRVLIVLCLLASGCGGWQSKARRSLVWAHTIGQGAQRVALPYFKVKCEERARKCNAAKDMVCKPLVECQGERRKLQYVLDNLDRSIMLAYTAVFLSDEKTWSMRWVRLLELVSDLNGLLQELELLK